MRQLTHGSLFAGIGGFDLGFERAGIKTVWQVEIDPFCRKVLEKHWPHVQRFSDIRECRELSDVDVISGGFPCQPFSSAGRGRGRGTESPNYLWPEMLRNISHVKPTWVVVENVTHIDRAILENVATDLEGCGYEVAPTLEVPACAFGHDHKRARYWILGYSDRDGKPILPLNAEVAGLQGCDCDSRRMGKKNGISCRMDRLRAVGNAVVPQIAEWIGRRIVAASGDFPQEVRK